MTDQQAALETHDLLILDKALSWLAENKQVSLVTLTRIFGSGPRKQGSILVISSHGELSGSVSGGCIENDLVERFTRQPADKVISLNYGIDKTDAAKFQLPCGSQIELIAEPFNDVAHILALRAHILERELVVRELDLQTGEVSINQASKHDLIDANELSVGRLFGPSWRALIIGANDLSGSLIGLLENLDFKVDLCDPRQAYQQSWPRPERLAIEQPEDWLDKFSLDARTAIIFVSHDAMIEDLAIQKALMSNAMYVGAMGSKRTTQKRKARLIEHFSASEDLFHKLDAPIGIDLGSKTSPEIAISIAAKLISVRNNATG